MDSLPILDGVSSQTAGYSFDCGWCGGSRDAFRRAYHTSETVVRKPLGEVPFEFETMGQIPNVDMYTFYSAGT